jgi:hypothetical protein
LHIPYRLILAAGRWETDRGGEYGAFGVGGSVTGRRADLVVIDDPVRSREDAESELIREKTWEWYRSDLITRLKPHGRIVLIQTRWHEDDLAGRLLEHMAAGGDRWDVIALPSRRAWSSSQGLTVLDEVRSNLSRASRDVRLSHKADMPLVLTNVCLEGKNGDGAVATSFPLMNP